MTPEFTSLFATLNQDPHGYYEQLRQQGDLVWDKGMNGWAVLSYEMCRYIEEREDLFRHPYADTNEIMLEIKGGPRNITVLQGEEHQKLRRYLSRMFFPKVVEAYTDDLLRPITDFVFSRIEKRGTADLAREVADQIPPRVFVGLLGMDWMDEALVTRELELHDHVMDWIGGNRSAEVTRRAQDASRELNAILIPEIRRRRSEPGTDIISRLWADAPEVFADVSEEDILAICRELFLAGSDTSVHAIANAYYLLLTQPEVREAVSSDREKALNNFIEESLRLLTVVQYRFRIANQDTVLAGTEVKRNDLLIPVNAAGNRDEAKFECPHMVKLDRPQPRSHLAFNMGPRMCIGAPLARAELREAIIAMLDRLPNVRLDPHATPPRFANIYTRSFRPLHVLFDPKA